MTRLAVCSVAAGIRPSAPTPRPVVASFTTKLKEKFSALVSEELRDKLKELLSGGETVEEILKKLENQNQLEKLQGENTDLSKEVTEL